MQMDIILNKNNTESKHDKTRQPQNASNTI